MPLNTRSKKACTIDTNLCLFVKKLHWSIHNDGFSESVFSLQMAKAPADIRCIAYTFYDAKIDDIVQRCESEPAFRDEMVRFIAYLKH